MYSNKKAELDKFGFPIDSPITNGSIPTGIVPWQWGMAQKIQAKQFKISRANIRFLGTLSGVATATGTIGAGSTQIVTNTLTPQPPHGTEMNFAIPYVSVYEGTTNVTGNLIFPGIGANKSWGSYSFQAALDWDNFANTTPGSVISVYRLTIHNNMNQSGTYFYISDWKWLNVNSGTVL